MKELINLFSSWIMKKRLPQIHDFINNPVETQQKVFNYLIKRAENTEWGQKYKYSKIKTIDEYQKQVPVQTYESLQPYIDRIMKGESNILWNTKIRWFAKSSGTTNAKSKYIPISDEAMNNCHFKGGKDLYSIYYELNSKASLFFGKNVVLGGSHNVSKLNKNIYTGDLSAVLIQNLPFRYELKRKPDLKIALMENWDEKIEKIVSNVIDENINHLVGVPTWTMILIKKILEIKGTDNLIDVWPNLELYVHGGVSFSPYKELFKKVIKKSSMKYLETYNASEGFFALQNDFNSDDLLLMLDYGIFYEFIPIDEINNENPKALTLNEVELNKNYAIVISTNGGLWRYIIGDTIRFTSIFPFKIKITGRIKYFINAFGEEVILENAEEALRRACKSTDTTIVDYTAAPVFFSHNNNGKHEWIIEFEKEPKDLEIFRTLLDKELQNINSDYEAKRYKNMALEKLDVIKVKKGTFYEYMKKIGKLGGQNKVPRLSNNREFIDKLKDFLNKS